MCEKSQTVIDRSTLNLFYIHIPVGSLMWQRKIQLYVNSPAWFFSFPSTNSFPGDQACTVAACGPRTPGFHRPVPDGAAWQTIHVFADAPILCAKRRVSDEPPPQMPLHCAGVLQCLFCSHWNTTHWSHCGISRGKKRGATLLVIQMCSSPYLLKSGVPSLLYAVIVHNVVRLSYWHGKLVENWVRKAVIDLTKDKSCKRVERIHQQGWAAAAPELTQDFSKWPEGRGWNLLSPSRDQKPSFLFLTDVTFPLKFPWAPVPSPPGAAWPRLGLLAFPPARPDFLTFFCAAVCGNEILFYLLWKGNASAIAAKCSCGPTRKKAGNQGLCRLASLFVPFYCIIVLARA